MIRRYTGLLFIAIMLIPAPTSSAGDAGETFFLEDAVVIGLSSRDLGRLAGGALLPAGGNLLEGHRDAASRGISDLSFSARLSSPDLHLGQEGDATLNLEILEGNLRVGRIEREFMRRQASCEDLGVDITGKQPVDLTIGLRFQVDERGLRIVPRQVEVTNLESNLRLIKPSRCDNTLLPRWMLWWIGKPKLKKRLADLDEVLLAKAIKGAAELGGDFGLLDTRWKDLHVAPRSLDTRGDALLVGFTAARGGTASPPASRALAQTPFPAETFVALSRTLMNELLRTAVARLPERPRRPGGSLNKLFRSDAILALIPGLRGVPDDADLFLTLEFPEPPAVDLGQVDEQATIRLRLAGAQVVLWIDRPAPEASARLGTLEIDSATVEVRPYVNRLGGVSFDLLENDWHLSSRGIEFDDQLLAATLQELVFAEVFETGYEPLGRHAFDVGPTGFRPWRFERVGDYLVIALEDDQANR